MTDEQLLISEESNTMRTLGNVSLFPQRKCTRGGGWRRQKCPQCVIKYFSHDAPIKIVKLFQSSFQSLLNFQRSLLFNS